MLIKIIKTIIGWIQEIWELLKVISDITPIKATGNFRNSNPSSTRLNALHQRKSNEEVIRHRYLELDGFAENLRIDCLGRYDLNQIAEFSENFVYVSPEAVDEFIDDTINYKCSIIEGKEVLWVPKADCIEFAYHQYSALADLL
tara:strand:+ start:2624 stop:3055 length:432 start_codon:yes stop_codon:yes gene_type:complete